MNQPKKKRTRDERVFDVLTQIEARLDKQQKTLDDLQRDSVSQKSIQNTDSCGDPLELAFKNLASALNNISQEERPHKIRHVLERNPKEFSMQLVEHMNTVWMEGFQFSCNVTHFQSDVPQFDQSFESSLELESFCKQLFDLS
eukprot:TRINITY_DN554_c0_g1_i4.p1 TRINITY_DN554_c0_g1~~TRINITY_DN554_c0_g1_i4.p1  ORF type:complete len:143 (+),score=22.61 TRINITY_DN554_c0_g1_i4:367-795(+)